MQHLFDSHDMLRNLEALSSLHSSTSSTSEASSAPQSQPRKPVGAAAHQSFQPPDPSQADPIQLIREFVEAHCRFNCNFSADPLRSGDKRRQQYFKFFALVVEGAVLSGRYDAQTNFDHAMEASPLLRDCLANWLQRHPTFTSDAMLEQLESGLLQQVRDVNALICLPCVWLSLRIVFVLQPAEAVSAQSDESESEADTEPAAAEAAAAANEDRPRRVKAQLNLKQVCIFERSSKCCRLSFQNPFLNLTWFVFPC